jgi:hypothetical protein
MTKSDIATQGKSTIEQRTQATLMTHVMPTTLQATDWETFLVCTGVIIPTIISNKAFLQSDQVNSQGQSHEYI